MRQSFVNVIRCAAVLVAMIALGGCVFHRPPVLEVVDTHWGEHTEDAQVLNIEVVLRNPASPGRRAAASEEAEALDPTRRAISILEVRYDVRLDGRMVYRGRRDASATLAAGGERRVILPAVIPTDTQRQGKPDPSRYQIAGYVWYRTTDRLTLILADMGLSRQRSRFSESGTIDPAEHRAAAER
jgi:hypothetical protein